MKKMIELVYREYAKKADSIQRGWISDENVSWVTDHLMLKNLSNEELSEMWETIDDFFEDIMAVKDETGKVIAWKPYTDEIAFAMDTDSAWKEVVNVEARFRKANGTL